MKLELGVKRKAKAPNPLSCKKKKVKQEITTPSLTPKRRRRKNKSASKIIETQLINKFP